MSSKDSIKIFLRALDEMLIKCLIGTSIFCYAMVFLLVFISVVIRFFELNSNVLSFNVWSYDITNFGVIWMVYMGAFIGVRNCDHVSVTMIKNGIKKWNPLAGKILLVINDLLALIVLLFLTKAVFAALMAARTQLLPRLPIMKFWWMLPIITAFVLMTIYMVINMVNNMFLSTKRHKEDNEEKS